LGSGVIAPPFLASLLDGGARSASRTDSLDRRLGGPQSLSGFCAMPGIEPVTCDSSGCRKRKASEDVAGHVTRPAGGLCVGMFLQHVTPTG
jgi:hypothetical protein